MEGGSLVAEAMLSSRELAEIFRSLGDDIIVEFEDDATSRLVVNGDVKLSVQEIQYFNDNKE